MSTLDLASVLPGFDDPAFGSQAAFRAALQALSRPGVLVDCERAAYSLCLALLDQDTLVFDPLLEAATIKIRTTSARGALVRATVTLTASSPPTPIPGYGVDPMPPFLTIPKLVSASAGISLFRDALPTGTVTVGRLGGKLTTSKRGTLSRSTASWASADT